MAVRTELFSRDPDQVLAGGCRVSGCIPRLLRDILDARNTFKKIKNKGVVLTGTNHGLLRQCSKR